MGFAKRLSTALSEADFPQLPPGEPLPDQDDFTEPQDGNIWADIPKQYGGLFGRGPRGYGWGTALESSMRDAAAKVIEAVKKRFGIQITMFEDSEFGFNTTSSFQKSDEFHVGFHIKEVRTLQDRALVEQVQQFVAEEFDHILLEDFIVTPKWITDYN